MKYALWHRRAGVQGLSLRLHSATALPRQSNSYLRRPFDLSWACFAWQLWNLRVSATVQKWKIETVQK